LFQSLFLKISLSVGLVVTFTLTVFAFFLIQNQKEHLLYAKMKEIETLSILIGHGVTNFMKEGKTKDFHDFLNLFSISDDLLEVRILDGSGSVLHSSRKSEEGTSMASLFPGGTVPGKAPPVFEQEIRGHPFLSTIRTFQNEPACFSCHGNQPRVLGILHVSLPMEATGQNLRLNRNLLMASTAITLLLMGLAINLLLTRLVKKPTGRLIETMSRVEQGNLDVRVSLGTQDELGRLAKNFDSMVQKLSTAQKEVERQHQQQMLQVRHLASLGELAASVAHEVRNPLAGIKLAIQILSKEPGLAHSHRETMFEIRQSIERVEKTMSDLLLYSRVRPPEFQPVSLPKVIEDALSSLKEEFQLSDLRVEKSFDPALPFLSLDSEQIRRVFLNLFLNALQAMPKGGRLKIETKYVEWGGILQESLIPPDKSFQGKSWAEITVTDTGEGMTPEVLQEIFRPFFTTKAKGTGLGLSLSRRIVEQHHARIFAESQVGVGTKFILFFPIPPPAEGIAGGQFEPNLHNSMPSE
jgi:two-component system NtrC family sensor kinase